MNNKRCQHKNTKKVKMGDGRKKLVCQDCNAFKILDPENKRDFYWVEPVKAIIEDFC